MPKHLRSREELICAILRASCRPDGVDSRKLYRLIISCISRYNKELIIPLVEAGYLSVEKGFDGGHSYFIYKITDQGHKFYEQYNEYLDMIRTPAMRQEIELAHSKINLFNDIFLG